MEQWPWIGHWKHILDTSSQSLCKEGQKRGMTEKKYQRDKSHADVAQEIELSLPTAVLQPALLCYDTHSSSPHTLWQERKMTYSLLHFYWPFHPRSADMVKRESTLIWPFPARPLKDKTTTIRLHFPASCPPHSSGYVHSNPILSPSTFVFI